MRQVMTVADADGNEIPSMTESYLAWREWFGMKGEPIHSSKRNGVCMYCGGWKELVTEQYGRLWCVCAVEERTRILQLQHSEFRSLGNQLASFENFEIWGEILQADKLIGMRDYLSDWSKSPKGWVTIIGPPGTGKSHLLSAINKMYMPWSLYMTSADFESKAFKATKVKKKDEDNEYDLEDMLNVISQAPILLFDDIGAEYGKDFVISLIRHVFDFRYQRPNEYLTISTSNHPMSELTSKWDARVSDRIFDKKLSHIISLGGCQSWRRTNGNS